MDPVTMKLALIVALIFVGIPIAWIVGKKIGDYLDKRLEEKEKSKKPTKKRKTSDVFFS